MMRSTVFKRAAVALLSAAALAVTAPAAGAATPAKPVKPKAVTAKPAPKGAAKATTTYTLLSSGQQLLPGQSISDDKSTLVMQGDGNLVIYLLGSSGNRGPALWSANTWGHQGAYAVMQQDGNLVIYRQGRTDPAGALWSTNSSGHWGATAQLLEGWLGVYSGGSIYWQSSGNGRWGAADGSANKIDDHACVAPGSWLESNSVWLINQSDGNLVLYRKRDGVPLWSSRTQGHPASYLCIDPTGGGMYLLDLNPSAMNWLTASFGAANAYGLLQDDGNFVIYRQGRTDPAGALWSTGTYGNW